MAAFEKFLNVDEVTNLLKYQTYAETCKEFCDRSPTVQGFSIRSLKRFCCKSAITKNNKMTKKEVDELVKDGKNAVSSW